MKNMLYFHYLFLSLVSCTYDNVFTNMPSSEYFPNMVGNYWEYSVVDSSHTSEGVKKYILTITIIGTKVMADGKPACIGKYQFPKWAHSYAYPDDRIDTIYVRIENDTVKTFDVYSRTIQEINFPRQIFLIPFQDNQKWNGKLYWIDNYTSSQIPNGYLIHYYYVGPNIEYIDQFYFKPNIGFVNLDMSHYDLAPIDHQIWQLKKYSLK